MFRFKQWAAKWMARRVVPGVYRRNMRGPEEQEHWLKYLLEQGKATAYGKQYGFENICTYEDFKARVPVVGYPDLEPYMQRISDGEEDVLWPGVPIYFSKTSGTTSGSKFIPITRESMPTHIRAARNALLFHIYHTGDARFVDGKMIFLQGSPELGRHGAIATGRLSGIVAHYVPNYLQKNRLPSWETNCIADWEEKLEAIADETLKEKMTLISGIPPWVKMYFERLLEKTGKANIAEVFPDFSLMVYGGVNFGPYRKTFEHLIGRDVHEIELFPSSEGFFAFQDEPGRKDMLLNLQGGIFYEFIPQSDWGKESPRRFNLSEVQLGEKYGLVISSNAGLWAYDVGDVVTFTSLKPYRLLVSGRTKHFTSLFGEHVIAEEVDRAMSQACEATGAKVVEYTVAPRLEVPEGEKPSHEWWVELEKAPADLAGFARDLDRRMCTFNPYYADLINGGILESLRLVVVQKNGFIDYMRSQGKLGGQNKVPRLANHREVVDALDRWSEKTIRSSK